MKGFIKFIAVVAIIVVLARSCNSSNSTLDSSVGSARNSDVEAPTLDIPDKTPKSNWEYSEETDRMSTKKDYYASTQSIAPIDFEFPYNGGSTFTIFVRKRGGKRSEIVLQCDKCQFIHRYTDDSYIKVKFDDKPAESYSFNTAVDGSSDVIFINASAKFIANLKKAEHLLIGAEFFQAGTKYIDFNVGGLTWDRK